MSLDQHDESVFRECRRTSCQTLRPHLLPHLLQPLTDLLLFFTPLPSSTPWHIAPTLAGLLALLLFLVGAELAAAQDAEGSEGHTFVTNEREDLGFGGALEDTVHRLVNDEGRLVSETRIGVGTSHDPSRSVGDSL